MDIEGIVFKPCKICGLDTPKEELVKGICEDCLTALYAPDIEDYGEDGFVAFEPRKRKVLWDDD